MKAVGGWIAENKWAIAGWIAVGACVAFTGPAALACGIRAGASLFLGQEVESVVKEVQRPGPVDPNQVISDFGWNAATNFIPSRAGQMGCLLVPDCFNPGSPSGSPFDSHD